LYNHYILFESISFFCTLTSHHLILKKNVWLAGRLADWLADWPTVFFSKEFVYFVTEKANKQNK